MTWHQNQDKVSAVQHKNSLHYYHMLLQHVLTLKWALLTWVNLYHSIKFNCWEIGEVHSIAIESKWTPTSLLTFWVLLFWGFGDRGPGSNNGSVPDTNFITVVVRRINDTTHLCDTSTDMETYDVWWLVRWYHTVIGIMPGTFPNYSLWFELVAVNQAST